jgi:hypothetical protein
MRLIMDCIHISQGCSQSTCYTSYGAQTVLKCCHILSPLIFIMKDGILQDIQIVRCYVKCLVGDRIM